MNIIILNADCEVKEQLINRGDVCYISLKAMSEIPIANENVFIYIYYEMKEYKPDECTYIIHGDLPICHFKKMLAVGLFTRDVSIKYMFKPKQLVMKEFIGIKHGLDLEYPIHVHRLSDDYPDVHINTELSRTIELISKDRKAVADKLKEMSNEHNTEKAMAEIRMILERHDLAGIVLLAGSETTEYHYNITPSWSNANEVEDHQLMIDFEQTEDNTLEHITLGYASIKTLVSLGEDVNKQLEIYLESYDGYVNTDIPVNTGISYVDPIVSKTLN